MRKTCICVTFNTWHPVCHIISRRCSWNEIQPHDFLTYEPFSACNFWHTIPSLSTLFARCDGLWCVFTVKRHNFMQSCDLQGHIRVQIFTYKDVSVFNVSPNFPMFYDNLNVSTQIFRLYVMFTHKFIHWKTCLVTFLSYGDVSEYSLTLSFPLLRLLRRNY